MPNAIKYMQIYTMNTGVSRWIRYDQEQIFRAKQFQLCCKYNIKILLEPVDDHRAKRLVKRLIQTSKHG